MSSATLQRSPRPSLLPLPVVVDACVLLRNVGYTLRKGWNGALVESASPEYTLLSGVVLFTTQHGLAEVEQHLPRVARDVGASSEAAWRVWNEVFLPRVRIIELDERLVSDPRVEAVRMLDPDDAPTAVLAVALAPCVLLTDNRKHFEPLGLPDLPVNVIALDIHQLSELVSGMNGAIIVTSFTGAGIAEGTKKIVSTLGKEAATLIALLLAGAAYLYWKSEPGSRFREGVKAAARDLGPPLMHAIADGIHLSEKISALAIESADDQPSAFRSLAQRLAVGQTTMSTAEVARYLSDNGYRFKNGGNYQTLVRAWLVANPCFFELQRGHWSLGYHALPRGAEAA
jgi:hypothetical protein